jgi:putative ABC transport system substrate-binding protein
MKRRKFVSVLAAAAFAWPHAARSRDPEGRWVIGFIAHTHVRSYDALFEGLRDLGYVEGQNLIIERRYAEGRAERFNEFAKEMVQLADLIVVVTTPAALAVMHETTAIPNVHPAAIDPVGRLVDSLAHPGKNLTGGAILYAELSAKRLQLLKDMVPRLSRTAVLWNTANPANAAAWRETESAARALGVTLQSHELRGSQDLEAAFTAIAEERPDALLLLEDQLTFQYRKEIVDFALRQRLPSSFVGREAVEAGGLMSYGARASDMYRRAAAFVDKLLKGANPADLPMEQPTPL